MKENIWKEIGLCLFKYSSYGSLPSAADLMASVSCQELFSLFSSTGTWHSCLSCAISEAAGAPQSCTAPFPFLSSFPFRPYSTPSLCLSPSAISAHSKPSALYRSSLHLSGFPSSKLASFQSLLRWCFPAELWCILVELSQFRCYVTLCDSFLAFFLSHRCKEGYHGLRCDQFVPKSDAILSDPSKLLCSLMFLFYLVFLYGDIQYHKNVIFLDISNCFKLIFDKDWKQNLSIVVYDLL